MPPTDRISALATELFQKRGADLLRFLRQRLGRGGNIVDARDIAQEPYLRFIRLGDPDRIEQPDAYLFRIASNLLFEHQLRERGLEAQRAPLEELPGSDPTPFSLTVSHQVSERLRGALEALPALQRAILILHLRDGLTCGAIGTQAGISASMVKKHLHAAIAFCRRRLRDL